jgi:hypothetical protein
MPVYWRSCARCSSSRATQPTPDLCQSVQQLFPPEGSKFYRVAADNRGGAGHGSADVIPELEGR